MDKDYLIVSREWHDGLHCPTRESTLNGVLRFRFITLTIPFPVVLIFYLLNLSLVPVIYLFLLYVLFSNNTFGF